MAEPDGSGTGPESGLNRARLEGLRKLIGDAEFRRLADNFLGDLTRRIDAMERLHAAGEHAMLAREAHTLRGTAGSYGLEAVGALASQLEIACAAGEPVGTAGALRTLSIAMAASAAQIKAWFELGPPGA